jgi:hypothetical protein
MEETLQTQIDHYLSHIDALIRHGSQLRDALAADPSNPSGVTAIRAWQEQCGATVNQLSGGSKAHWLARSFSNAFLVRSSTGSAVEGVAPGELVDRLIAVLQQAVASLSQTDGSSFASSASPESSPRPRFDFVHNPELRPVVEQAFVDSRSALDQGRYEEALRTSCGILEAIVTDALEYQGPESLSSLAASTGTPGKIADCSFEARLAIAEKAGLIRGGCARLPAAARTYRDQHDDRKETGLHTEISERDAKVTAQVLRTIMRDLDPGR